MQNEQTADTEMAAAAKGSWTPSVVSRLAERQMRTQTARTNTLMIFMAISSIVLGIVPGVLHHR